MTTDTTKLRASAQRVIADFGGDWYDASAWIDSHDPPPMIDAQHIAECAPEKIIAILDHVDDQAAEIERLRQPWISVNERLPDTEEVVLVLVPGARYQKVDLDCWRAQHESPVGWSSATIETGMAWDDHEFEEVTHWMPLPAAPSAALSGEGK